MKYIKPKSVTWWAAVVPLAAGAFIALEPVHGLTAWVQSVQSMFGGVTPAEMINAGLFGIGLRGALA